MPEPVVEIPNRPAFRASEVCEIAQIPPYVLKSWEKEFPGLGVASKPGGPRVYRRADVEQVLRIKHLLFAEGLTLAGARRKLEGEPKPEEEPLPELPFAPDVRDKVSRIKQDLRSLLEMLSAPPDKPRAESGDRARAADQETSAKQTPAAAGERGGEASQPVETPAAEGTDDEAAEQATTSSGGRDEAAAVSSRETSRWPPERGGEPDAGASSEAGGDLPLNGEAPAAADAKPARKPRKSARTRAPRG